MNHNLEEVQDIIAGLKCEISILDNKVKTEYVNKRLTYGQFAACLTMLNRVNIYLKMSIVSFKT